MTLSIGINDNKRQNMIKDSVILPYFLIKMMCMTEFFNYLISKVERALGEGGLCLIFIALCFFVFLIFLAFWLIKKQLTKKHFICFSLVIFSLITLEGAIEKLCNKPIKVQFVISVWLIFLAVLYALPSLKKQIKLDPLQFAKALDFKYKAQRPEHVENVPKIEQEKQVAEIIKPALDKKENSLEIDFSHVFSVIKRLEYYNLTQSDKKQVVELEKTLRTAQQSGDYKSVKQKINDGLGSLLKIMSKYGV